MSLLTARGVRVQFGGVTALDDVSLELNPGEVVGLIGPNGAGKTTMVNVITGFVRPTAGEVWMGGRSMLGLPPHHRARLGVARTFQVVRLFKSMTVLDNLTVPSERFERGGLIADCLRLPLAGAAERRARSVAEGVLEELGLVDVRDQAAGTLPLGMQRRVEIARALCSRPRVLLLDEAASGVGRAEAEEIGTLVRNLCARHQLAVLLIEHDVRLVMGVSDHVYVLDFGRLLAEGTPDQVSRDPAVIEAYLGETDVAAAG
jgi:branched-chain amino acid transport system ATP-binding protein